MSIPIKKLNDGVEIPMLALGTWQQEGEKCVNVIKMALEIGYRHIDTAHAYYNHDEVRRGIGDYPRDRFFVTTKLWREFHRPELVEPTCDQSLKDLGMDYIDLYLIHWPEKENMIDLLAQMHKLKDRGKVRSVGLCNATIHHVRDTIEQKVPISMNQVEFHPFLNQDELLQFCHENHIDVTGYSPIAHGKVFKEPVIREIAQKHNKTSAQISLRWLHQKDIIVPPKGSSMAHMKENMEIFDFELGSEEMKKIDEVNRNERIVVPDFNEFDYQGRD